MSRSQQTKREPITSLDHVMTFGRYKGLTIKDILEDQPHYLTWLIQNTDTDIDHKILDLVETSYEEAARNAKLTK